MTGLPGVCLVCRERVRDVNSVGHDMIQLDCPRCGVYLASSETTEDIWDDHQHPLRVQPSLPARVGYHLHLIGRGQAKPPVLLLDDIETIAHETYTPPLAEQSDNLIRLIGEKSVHPGETVELRSEVDQFRIGAASPQTMGLLAIDLMGNGLVAGNVTPETDVRDRLLILRLTVAGWHLFEEIIRSGSIGARAFMAMPFNHPDLDDAWLPAIRNAVHDTGFTLHRIDDELKPGIIDVRMRQAIKDTRFAIVELTHANNGAYWEAGFAEGLGKPVIYTCRKGETNIHFDASHLQRIEWEPDRFGVATDQLKAMIRISVPEAKRDS